MSTQKRIEEIRDRIEWMNENLSGCDWCCGGGDEEMAYLVGELQRLENDGMNLCGCGGKPLMSLEMDFNQNYWILCCKCCGYVEAKSKGEVLEKWNRL